MQDGKRYEGNWNKNMMDGFGTMDWGIEAPPVSKVQ